MEELKLWGQTIQVTDEQEMYNVIWRKYCLQEKMYITQLAEEYHTKKDLDYVMENVGDWGREKIYDSVDRILDSIAKYGIYTYNRDTYIERYVGEGINYWINAVAELFEEYMEISKRGNDAEIQSLKKKMYNSPKTFETLSNGLGKTIMEIMYSEIKINKDELGIDTFTISQTDIEKSQAIVDNVEAGRVPKDRIKDALITAIRLNPYNKKAYSVALYRIGDITNELEKVGEFFYIDVKNGKDYIIKSVFEKNYAAISKKEENTNLKDDLNKCKENIISVMRFLGREYDPKNELVKELETTLYNIEQREKTYNGVKYDTVELAEAVKRDDEKFEHFLLGKNLIENESLEKVKKDLAALEFETSIFKNSIEERLNEYVKLQKGDYELLAKKVKVIYRKIFGRDNYSNSNMEYISDAGDYYIKLPNNSDDWMKFESAVLSKIALSDNNERVIVYIRCEYGDKGKHGIVFTNKEIYILDGNKQKYKTSFQMINRIKRTKQEYILSEKNGNVFNTFGSTGIDSSVLLAIQNFLDSLLELLKKACIAITDEVTEGKSDLSEIRNFLLEESKELSQIIKEKTLKRKLFQSFYTIDQGDRFDTCMANITKEIKKDFIVNEIPFFINISSFAQDGIVITDKHIYIFNYKLSVNSSVIENVIDLDELQKIGLIERKFGLVVRIGFYMKDGSVIEAQFPIVMDNEYYIDILLQAANTAALCKSI